MGFNGDLMGFFGHLLELNGGLMGFNGAEASGTSPQLCKISIRLTISMAIFNGYVKLPKGNDNVYIYIYIQWMYTIREYIDV